MSCGSWIIEPGVPTFDENLSVAGENGGAIFGHASGGIVLLRAA